ncbi:MAG TPA: hypothetical protein VJA94_07330 [Candidatus Angelobacter sp.]
MTVAFAMNNRAAQNAPNIELGTSGGNATDFVDSGGTRTCCSGTLGAVILKGGTPFILSNNHVLFKSGSGSSSDNIQQPGLVDNQCDVTGAPVATTVAGGTPGSITAAALKPSPCSGVCTGPAPSNVDAAIAQITPGTVDTSGGILELGAAGSSGIATAPPSSTIATPAVGQSVAKSGRSTGLTCSTVSSVSTAVSVQYATACGGATAFTSTFNNQVIISGGSFSASGDSGSLVVTSDNARPVGLLFAGNSTSTTANPIQDVLNAFTNASGTPTVVGAGDHAVSCQPTASPTLASSTAGPSSAKLSVQETDRVAAVKDKYANKLLQDSAIAEVAVGASADSPGEGALVITLQEPTTVPAVLDGVRTRLTYAFSPAPRASVDAISGAKLLNQAHAQALIQQSGIQGVGIGISDDNPAEPAMVIYLISGISHPGIPPVIDGLRTRIIEGDRFRAFGWGRDAVNQTSCSQKKPHARVAGQVNLKKKLPKISPQ